MWLFQEIMADAYWYIDKYIELPKRPHKRKMSTLDSSSHLYKSVCPSVHLLVRAFVKNARKSFISPILSLPFNALGRIIGRWAQSIIPIHKKLLSRSFLSRLKYLFCNLKPWYPLSPPPYSSNALAELVQEASYLIAFRCTEAIFAFRPGMQDMGPF